LPSTFLARMVSFSVPVSTLFLPDLRHSLAEADIYGSVEIGMLAGC